MKLGNDKLILKIEKPTYIGQLPTTFIANLKVFLKQLLELCNPSGYKYVLFNLTYTFNTAYQK